MKALLIVALAVVVIGVPIVQEISIVPECRPMLNLEELDTYNNNQDDDGPLITSIEVLTTVDQLNDFLKNHSEAMIFSSYLRKDPAQNESCIAMAQDQYGVVQYNIMKDYKLGYAMADCPSEVCTRLNVSTYFAVDFFKQPFHLDHFGDGLRVGDYKERVAALYDSEVDKQKKKEFLVFLIFLAALAG